MALPPIQDGDHQQGNPNAPVTLVHYGDFECPYSGAAYYAVQALQEIFGDKMRYIFRPFPLEDIHPHSLHAACAAECAARQDQFWPMYDLLFGNQSALSDRALERYAGSLGLDTARFANDMDAPGIMAVVQKRVQEAREGGVHGTPSFFVNGEFHDNKEGLWSAARLRTVLQAALDARS